MRKSKLIARFPFIIIEQRWATNRGNRKSATIHSMHICHPMMPESFKMKSESLNLHLAIFSASETWKKSPFLAHNE
jgi:hypothetical protein